MTIYVSIRHTAPDAPDGSLGEELTFYFLEDSPPYMKRKMGGKKTGLIKITPFFFDVFPFARFSLKPSCKLSSLAYITFPNAHKKFENEGSSLGINILPSSDLERVS